eukprot:TRINITY_DN18270_c0_g1_i1.p1 TRINITY_DN18270_c0_g1~~TRINITY_DN18270_c0_g1_i1.p1  ORF type:complete len:342 (+),score=36.13 TRINITY_DN18270_c0_g1_i1:85-1110(+)
MKEKKSIFVSIPSYRDPECQKTVKDLFDKAETPERVFVGICWQSNDAEDAHCFEIAPPFPKNVRVCKFEWTWAKGPCLARHHAQTLYGGEDYYLSIDSHTRFIPNWDSRLISLLHSCPSKKPILTGYPAGYTLPDKLSDNKFPPFLCISSFGADGMLRFTGKTLNQSFPKPTPSLAWVSGFSFSSAQMLKEVPYDKHLPFIFFGEESSMTVRLYTHGWDFFAPSEHIVYHLWKRDYRPNFRENPDKGKLQQISFLRIKHLLNILTPEEKAQLEGVKQLALQEIDKYGLGNHPGRTVETFQSATGINFAKQTITPRAQRGGLDKKYFMDTLMDMILSNLNKD